MYKTVDGVCVRMEDYEIAQWEKEQAEMPAPDPDPTDERLKRLEQDQEDQWLAMAEMTFGGGETV